VAEVFLNYLAFKQKAKNFESEDVYKRAAHAALETCGDIRVSQLNILARLKLIGRWRGENIADSTTLRRLGALWPAFDRAIRDELMINSEKPLMVERDDWHPIIQTIPPAGQRPVCPPLDSLMQACEIALYVCLVVRPRHPIHTGGDVSGAVR
jgi:hypothetical protein